jgi:hypothetical protein
MADALYREQVVIDADTVSAERGFDRVQQRAGAFERAVQGIRNITVNVTDRATGPLAAIGRAMASIGRGVTLGIGLGIAGQLFGVLNMIQGAVIGMNAELETSTFQFTTLMGNADEAAAHVKDLFEFAKKTPFESGPVIAASRTLRTFGGATLDTMENLTTFGDAAAATQNDIKEVAFWVSRMHNSMEAGASFGEEIRRMQEMALLGPKVSQKLMELSKSGKATEADFHLVTDEFKRFSGAMERMQFTWAGVTSTFTDTIRILGATAFKPFFELLRDALHGLNDLLGSDDVGAMITGFSETLAGSIRRVSEVLAQAWPIINGVFTGIKAVIASVTTDPGAIGIIATLIKDAFGERTASAVRPFLEVGIHLASVIRQMVYNVTELFAGRMSIGGFIRGALDSMVAVGQDLGRRVLAAIGNSLSSSNISRVFLAIETSVMTLATSLGIAGPVGRAIAWLQVAFIHVEDAARIGLGWLTATAWPRISAQAHAVLDWLTGPAWTGIKDASAAALGWATDAAWPWLQHEATAALDWLQTTGLWGAIKSSARDALDWVTGPAWDWLKGAAINAWTTINATVFPMIEAFGNWLLEKAGGAIQTFVQPGGLWDQMKAKGADAITAVQQTAGKTVFDLIADPRIPKSLEDLTKGLDAFNTAFGNLQKLFAESKQDAAERESLRTFLLMSIPAAVISTWSSATGAFRALGEALRDVTGALVEIQRLGLMDYIFGPGATPRMPTYTGPAYGPPLAPTAAPPGPPAPESYPSLRRFPEHVAPPLVHGGAQYGALVTGPTVMMVGEGNESEAVLPLSDLFSLLRGGVAGVGGDVNISVPVTLSAAGGDLQDVERLARKIGEPVARIIAREIRAAQGARSGG